MEVQRLEPLNIQLLVEQTKTSTQTNSSNKIGPLFLKWEEMVVEGSTKKICLPGLFYQWWSKLSVALGTDFSIGRWLTDMTQTSTIHMVTWFKSRIIQRTAKPWSSWSGLSVRRIKTCPGTRRRRLHGSCPTVTPKAAERATLKSSRSTSRS